MVWSALHPRPLAARRSETGDSNRSNRGQQRGIRGQQTCFTYPFAYKVAAHIKYHNVVADSDLLEDLRRPDPPFSGGGQAGAPINSQNPPWVKALDWGAETVIIHGGSGGVEVEVEVEARLAATKAGRGGRVASRKKGCVGCVVDVQNEK